MPAPDAHAHLVAGRSKKRQRQSEGPELADGRGGAAQLTCVHAAAVHGGSGQAGDTRSPRAQDDGGANCVLPSDTLAALHVLRAQFPKLPGVAPFALRPQLYTVLRDPTAADRELDVLRRSNAVRVLKLPCGQEDYAVVLTSDYAAAVMACAAALEAGAVAAQRALLPVFGWFVERVLPACCDVVITHEELLRLLAQPPRAQAPAPGTLPAAPPPPREAPVGDRHVALLLQQCCLTRHTGQFGPGGGGGIGECYVFALPASGAAVRSVDLGRREILGALARRREVLEAALTKRGLRRSVLGVRWHVREMVGAGTLLRLSTTVGPLLRVARKG